MKIDPKIRTDLALEARESFPEEGGEIPGVLLEETEEEETGIRITKVTIRNQKGAKAMGKPMGNYITLEAPALAEPDEGYHREISEALAKELTGLFKEQGWEEETGCSILVVGLGNSEVTSDSLGPLAVNNLHITRNISGETGGYEISGIVPGVMAQTGMETAEILKGIVEETYPDCLIVIDALAARSVARLGTTIQLTDTGIQPGSGIGNYRSRLSEETLGVPVIAIGVPTVVSAATIVYDTVDALVETLKQEMAGSGMGEMVAEMSGEEKYRLITEILEPRVGPMFVTPKNIDETVKRLSYTISEGLNLAFQGAPA
ncbi:MAG: GPR endopeptidase [Lachnospiraceae bacterium]|nr:GPR endopeptidase [Lachnospiraceae bacterium]